MTALPGHHGLNIGSSDAIAIMTECDDREAAAQARDGMMRFLAAPATD